MRKLLPLILVFLVTLSGTAFAGSRGELLRLTNSERISRNIPRLILDREVSKYAYKHSVDMATKGGIYHTDTKDFSTILKGTNWSIAGENVGAGYSIQAIQDAFMASNSHRENILMTSYTHIAIGVYLDTNGVYWITVIFYG